MHQTDTEKQGLARRLGLPEWKIPLWDGIHAWAESNTSGKRFGGDLMGAERAVVQIERVVEEALAKTESERDGLADALLALVNFPSIAGLGAHIRDEAARRGVANPLLVAEAALRAVGRSSPTYTARNRGPGSGRPTDRWRGVPLDCLPEAERAVALQALCWTLRLEDKAPEMAESLRNLLTAVGVLRSDLEATAGARSLPSVDAAVSRAESLLAQVEG